MFKKIFIFSIIFVLFLLTSICLATDSINMDLSTSSNTSTPFVDNTTIDNANLDLNENPDVPDTDSIEDETEPTISTTTTYEDSDALSITNIINIILIVVGIVIILLGIAIIIKIK